MANIVNRLCQPNLLKPWVTRESQDNCSAEFEQPAVKLRSWTAVLQAEDFYQKFVSRMQSKYKAAKVKTGKFAAMMAVELINDVS